MKVTTEKIEKSRVVLNIEVDSDEMEEAIKKAYRRLGAKASIPGFRKGKAPVAILEQYIGREAFVEDAAEHMLPDVYEKAVVENEVNVVGRPEVEIIQSEPLAFKATVPVHPTVEVGDYSTIKFAPILVEVTEEEVNGVLENIRYHQAPWQPVERTAQMGDLLTIDIEGAVGDETIIDQKEGQYQLQQGLPPGFPGFAEQLEGVEKGEEREFALTMPEENPEFGGKDCNFKVKVSEIKEKSLPEPDDEFAKSLGQGMETIDMLKERLSADIKTRKDSEAFNVVEEKALGALVELATIEYPDELVERQVDHLIDERKGYFGSKDALQHYLESINKSEEDLRNELKPAAEQIVVRSFVLQKYAEIEGIEVTPEDLDAEIERLKEHTADESAKKFFNSPAARESLARNLYTKKAVERLIEIATEGQIPVPPQQLEESVESSENKVNEEGEENGDAAQ